VFGRTCRDREVWSGRQDLALNACFILILSAYP
jgi:hypothetical protein